MSLRNWQRSKGGQKTNLSLYTAGKLLCIYNNIVTDCLTTSDTVTRSGMFCAMATVIDRCKTEGVVDVFQVVKALRIQRPGAVPTVVSSGFPVPLC